LTPLPLDVSGAEGLASGVTEGLPEVGGAVVVFALFDGVADALPVGAWPAQLAAGVGVSSAVRLDVLACGLELSLADAAGEVLPLALASPVGLALALVALPFGLALALTVSLGLALALCDGLAVVGDAVTSGLVAPLAEAVDRAELDVVGFGELAACDWDGDTHGTADGLVFPGDALPSTPLAEELRPVPPAGAELAVLLDEPANTSVLAWTNASRSGGTAASTTATANTATPMASAGRSMASRQSRGDRRAGRAWPGPRPVRPGRGAAPCPRGALCSPRPPDKRRTRPARTPEPHRARLAPASGSAAEA
jgi:hypothetical protein